MCVMKAQIISIKIKFELKLKSSSKHFGKEILKKG